MRAALLALCFTTAGCAESQTALDDARSYVRQSGEELLRGYAIIDAGCAPPEPAFCPELKAWFNKVRDGYTKINEALP